MRDYKKCACGGGNAAWSASGSGRARHDIGGKGACRKHLFTWLHRVKLAAAALLALGAQQQGGKIVVVIADPLLLRVCSVHIVAWQHEDAHAGKAGLFHGFRELG